MRLGYILLNHATFGARVSDPNTAVILQILPDPNFSSKQAVKLPEVIINSSLTTHIRGA